MRQRVILGTKLFETVARGVFVLTCTYRLPLVDAGQFGLAVTLIGLAAWVTGKPVALGGSLGRVKAICAQTPDLFQATFIVLATHQSVPRDILAAAIKQFRPELNSLTQDDVVGLLTALWNGGKQGFDTVLRTRRGAPRSAAAHPWASAD